MSNGTTVNTSSVVGGHTIESTIKNSTIINSTIINNAGSKNSTRGPEYFRGASHFSIYGGHFGDGYNPTVDSGANGVLSNHPTQNVDRTSGAATFSSKSTPATAAVVVLVPESATKKNTNWFKRMTWLKINFKTKKVKVGTTQAPVPS